MEHRCNRMELSMQPDAERPVPRARSGTDGKREHQLVASNTTAGTTTWNTYIGCIMQPPCNCQYNQYPNRPVGRARARSIGKSSRWNRRWMVRVAFVSHPQRGWNDETTTSLQQDGATRNVLTGDGAVWYNGHGGGRHPSPVRRGIDLPTLTLSSWGDRPPTFYRHTDRG